MNDEDDDDNSGENKANDDDESEEDVFGVTTVVNLRKHQVGNPKYTPTQLGVTGPLLLKTICNAPPNGKINRRQSYTFALNTK